MRHRIGAIAIASAGITASRAAPRHAWRAAHLQLASNPEQHTP